MKSRGSHFTIHIILNLSLSCIITDVGRFILFPFKVILTSSQSISMVSQIMFFFNFMCSLINFPVIFNKWMLSAVQHNFTSTYYRSSDINSIIFTALENKCPPNSLNFLALKIKKTTIPNINILNMHIVYHWNLQVHSIYCNVEICSCLVTVPTSLI